MNGEAACGAKFQVKIKYKNANVLVDWGYWLHGAPWKSRCCERKGLSPPDSPLLGGFKISQGHLEAVICWSKAALYLLSWTHPCCFLPVNRRRGLLLLSNLCWSGFIFLASQSRLYLGFLVARRQSENQIWVSFALPEIHPLLFLQILTASRFGRIPTYFWKGKCNSGAEPPLSPAPGRGVCGVWSKQVKNGGCNSAISVCFSL